MSCLYLLSCTTTISERNPFLPNSYSFQTVVLKGLNKEVTKKHIYKKARKSGDVKEIIYPVTVKAEAEGEAQGEDQIEEGTGMTDPILQTVDHILRSIPSTNIGHTLGLAHIIYNTAALAATAVQQLDGHIFKGSALHATLLQSPSVYKRCRLIVRNLPWKVLHSS